MPKKMLSRKQCVFLIVVLPVLIVPALLIINHADGQIDEVFIPPRRPKAHTRSAARELMVPHNYSVVKKYMHTVVKPMGAKPAARKPVKCFDYIWSGTCRDTCYSFNVLHKQNQRKQTVLKCEKSKALLKTVYTSKQKLVYKTTFQDPCLQKAIDKYCHDNKRVPNIVHYVWFGKNEFTFIHFLSFLSAYKIQNPCLIMLHADKLPVGRLWNYFLQICPTVVQVKRRQPKRVFQKKLVFVEHKADIAKLEALKEYGGIYVDTDQLILKPLDVFRNDDTTIGLDYSTQVANSLILAKPQAAFIKLWYDSYRTFSKIDGNKHSQIIPYKLSKRHPELVKVVGTVFTGQTANQLSNIYVKNVGWSHQYGMHMHFKLQNRFYIDKMSLENVRIMNSTAGSVARWILYQNTEMCGDKTLLQ